MWRITLFTVAATIAAIAGADFGGGISNGDQLVSQVFMNCVEMGCVKENVLSYLDNVLNIQSDSRNLKSIDAAIFKRAARVLKTHELRLRLPEMLFDQTELLYNPRSGLDFSTGENEGRGLLKKKLLFPLLLLLKLKMKALMPIFMALIGIKAMKALILSKLAIAIVLGFVAYQLFTKAGMSMPMSMMPAPPAEPLSMYGPPNAAPPSTSPPSSYEPGWEPNQGGPYSRVWNSGASNEAQSVAYSAYYPGVASSSTTRP